jgi:hypothetical protein
MARTGWCPKCGAEYRPGFTTCADCGVALVDDPPAPTLDPLVPTAHPDRRIVELARVPALEARMLVNRLRAEGALTADVGAEPIYGSFNFAAGIPIYVADDELALARRILGRLDEEEPADGDEA